MPETCPGLWRKVSPIAPCPPFLLDPVCRCHAEGVNEGALCLPRPDVMLLWGELEQARDVLAQVQALHMEVAESIRAYKTTEPDPSQCSVHRETGSRKPAVRTPMKAPRGSSTGKSSTTAAHTSAQERNKRGTLSTTHSKTRCKARAPIRYNINFLINDYLKSLCVDTMIAAPSIKRSQLLPK